MSDSSFAPTWVKNLKPANSQGESPLAVERAKSNLQVDELQEFLFSAETLRRNQRLVSILSSDPAFDKSQNYFLGRLDKVKQALARGKRLHQLAQIHQWTRDEYLAAYDFLGEPTPYGLHLRMFIVTLKEQGTPEQQKLFLERAEKFQLIGCYAQTELGHGSNVRGLETTATWSPEDKTFIIHSPSLTASKWWIGSLGKAANHAIVMAQLIIDGKNYGPHPFVVQIRDLETHQTLENVFVGDNGPKFGFNDMDNGFLLLNHVKIPHINMLARFSRVDPDTNQYIPAQNPALAYGTMTWVRSRIVLIAGSSLASGVTTAVRYGTVRRQFRDQDDPKAPQEMAVLDYVMVQHRLLPLLAASYALHFTGRRMIQLYEKNQEFMNSQKSTAPNPLLASLHAASCALKAFTSTVAGEGLETCRRACGGHGYSAFAGIGTTYSNYLPNMTWEGDNYMLTQQVSRYLLNMGRQVLKSPTSKAEDKANGIVDVLRKYHNNHSAGASFNILDDDSDLVDAFAWRVAFLTFQTLKRRDQDGRSWNSLQVDFWRLSTAYAQWEVVNSYYQTLIAAGSGGSGSTRLSTATFSVQQSLFRLFALHLLHNEAREFATSGAYPTSKTELVQDRVLQLLAEVRPHAVALVDAWSFTDWQLNSSLGRADGKVYEDMFYRASELNPLNKITFNVDVNSKELFRGEGTAGRASKL